MSVLKDKDMGAVVITYKEVTKSWLLFLIYVNDVPKFNQGTFCVLNVTVFLGTKYKFTYNIIQTEHFDTMIEWHDKS